MTSTRKPKKAGLYVRISEDRDGNELGVARQRAECTKHAKSLGWSLSPIDYTDDDRGAYSKRRKRRDGYERLLDDVRNGVIDGIVAWHPDRLHRDTRELEDFIDLVDDAGVPIATMQAGHYDLTTPSGRMAARILGAVAKHESEHKSERIKSQRDQQARTGVLNGGGRRAYGYDATGMTIDKKEAKIVREMVDRFIGGESLRSIAHDVNARGIPTSTGSKWGMTTVRKVITGYRVAGLRVHRGEVIGAGTWEPIVTRKEHETMVAMLANGRKQRVGHPGSSLLGGIARCAVCGHTLHLSTTNKRRRYVCSIKPGRDSCGGVAIAGNALDALVRDDIVAALATGAFANARSGRKRNATDKTRAHAAKQLQDAENDLELVAVDYGDGILSRRAYLAAVDGINKRIDEARRTLGRSDDGVVALHDVPSDPRELVAKWEDEATPIAWRRGVVSGAFKSLTVSPASRPRAGVFEPERVTYEWRD